MGCGSSIPLPLRKYHAAFDAMSSQEFSALPFLTTKGGSHRRTAFRFQERDDTATQSPADFEMPYKPLYIETISGVE